MTLGDLARTVKPDADVTVVDGFAVPAEERNVFALAESAEVTLAKRGQMPDPEDFRAMAAALNPPGTADALARVTVGVAGCGGLGSHAALALARLGVGRMVLVDFDVVEPTNLNRQAYNACHIGRHKVDALAELLAACNPSVSVSRVRDRVTADNALRIFSGCPVVIECFDRPEEKAVLVEALLAASEGPVVVAASGLAGLGPANEIVTRRAAKRLWLIGDGTSAIGPGAGLAAPRVLIAAGHQALCAARIILGNSE